MGNNMSQIKRLVRYYTKMTGSRDPVVISNYIGIRIAIVPLGSIAGNYMLLKRKRWIFVNEDIPTDSPMFKVIVAHELGHALLHRKENCAFIRNKTLLSTSRIEREANAFSAYLLISDDTLEMCNGITIDSFCNSTGYPKELVSLRINTL